MSFSLNTSTGVITQSGTDTDLNGLSGITGVTVYDDDPTKGKVTYDMGDLRLKIEGTLSHDPDRELMIFHHEKSSSSNSVSQPVIQIASGATYNYGVKTTTSDGKIGYSSGCGLMITGRGFSNWHPSDNAINFGSSSASFVCRGGVIESSRGLYFGGNADIEETVFLNASDRFSLEIRVFGNTSITTDRAQNIVLAGGISVMDAYRMTEQKIIFRKGAISRVFGTYYEAELFDFDVSKNVFNYDIGNCANNGQSIQDHHIVNSATGSDVRSMWRNTTGNASQMGNTFIHKEVSFNIKDTSATGIDGVKLYLEDNPSSFAKSISVTTTNTSSAHTYPNPTLSNATVSNSGKTISYDYTGVIKYEKTTDINGDIAKFRVLTATQFLEYTAHDSSATQYYSAFSGGVWRESDGQAPKYSDWDTNRFGNFYKVDRRSDSNSNADDFTFKFCSYGHILSSTTQELKGIGELEVDWILFDDALITDPKATTDAYTEIDTPQKFYNKAKAHLVDNYAGQSSTIVSRDGDTVNAGSYDVILSNSAVNVFSLSGNTITLKASSFVGNITTSGAVTLSGVNYTGTIIDSSGTRSFGSYEIKNLVSGSRVQVYNLTSSTEIYNDIVNATTLTQGFDTSEMVDGDSIRVRIAYQSGITAKEPQEFTVTCRTPAWEVNASQGDAVRYNAYQVDGSGINEFTLDLANGKIEVDISDADNSTNIQRIGAWYYSQLMTSSGIAHLFNAINWIAGNQISIDQSKVNLQLDNKKSDPLLLTGGRLYRLNETTIIAPTSNSIQIDYSPIYITNAPLIEVIDKNTKLIPALL